MQFLFLKSPCRKRGNVIIFWRNHAQFGTKPERTCADIVLCRTKCINKLFKFIVSEDSYVIGFLWTITKRFVFPLFPLHIFVYTVICVCRGCTSIPWVSSCQMVRNISIYAWKIPRGTKWCNIKYFLSILQPHSVLIVRR